MPGGRKNSKSPSGESHPAIRPPFCMRYTLVQPVGCPSFFNSSDTILPVTRHSGASTAFNSPPTSFAGDSGTSAMRLFSVSRRTNWPNRVWSAFAVTTPSVPVLTAW